MVYKYEVVYRFDKWHLPNLILSKKLCIHVMLYDNFNMGINVSMIFVDKEGCIGTHFTQDGNSNKWSHINCVIWTD